MKKLFYIFLCVLFIPVLAYAGWRTLSDGTLKPTGTNTNVEIDGSVSVGGADPLSIDTDGDGDADFTLGTSAPAAADSTGVAGTVFFADDYIYVCIATDTWVRVGLSTW